MTSGELVHQPDLLRLRAEITTAAYPDRTDEAVEDLVAAVEIGLAQGSLVLALRAANDLARLPHDQPRRTGATGSAPCSSGSRPIPRAPNWPRRSTSSGSDVARSGGSVAILGGGMGALATAFELSEGDWTDRFERITVYQRGWRLGGKGASSRGPNGRIEEHGLHVLLGYYDHTFDVMRRCYEALDRGRSDPSCPIRTWDDAVAPSNLVGVVDRHDGEWEPWVATFSPFAGRPGGGAEGPAGSSPLAVADLVVRSLRLLVDFFASLPFPDVVREWLHRVQHLADASVRPHRGAGGVDDRRRPGRGTARPDPPAQLGRSGSCNRPRRGPATGTSSVSCRPSSSRSGAGSATDCAAGPRRGAATSWWSWSPPTSSASWPTACSRVPRASGPSTTSTTASGCSGTASTPRRSSHPSCGACTTSSSATRTAIRPGRASVPGSVWNWRPRCSSGTRARCSGRCRPAWARWSSPRSTRSCATAASSSASSTGSMRSGSPTTGARSPPSTWASRPSWPTGSTAYDPLIRVKGLPCWPDAPLVAQLRGTEPLGGRRPRVVLVPAPRRRSPHAARRARTSTSWCSPSPWAWCRTSAESSWRRRRPGGRWSTTWERSPPRRSSSGCPRTRRRSVGPARSGATVSGFVKPFDTWASMAHLLPAEDWPETDRPRTIAYFCSVLDTPAAGTARPTPSARHGPCERGRRRFLDRDVATLWPAAVEHGGFRWSLLCDGATQPAQRRPSGSTASTGGRTSTPPTSTCNPCPAPTSTACSRVAPASATSPWPATGRTTA